MTAAAIAITAERARTENGDVAFGWGIERDDVARVVRWRDCDDRTACTVVLHERSYAELEGIDLVGPTKIQTPDGQERIVEVQQLHFGPPPPNRLMLTTETRARMEEAAPEPVP